MKLSIDQVKSWLEIDPGMILYLLRSDLNIAVAGLNDFTWRLAEDWTCTRNTKLLTKAKGLCYNEG